MYMKNVNPRGIMDIIGSSVCEIVTVLAILSGHACASWIIAVKKTHTHTQSLKQLMKMPLYFVFVCHAQRINFV